MWRLVWIALALASAGCPPAPERGTGEDPEVCRRAGQRCRLAKGEFGICMSAGPGTIEFSCIPQH